MSRIITIVLAISFGVALNAQQVINYHDGSLTSEIESTAPHRQVIQQDGGIIVRYDFSCAIITPDDIFSDSYWWKIDGFGFNETSGEASTLRRLDSFTVPDGHIAEVEVLDTNYVDFHYKLAPARFPLIDSGDEQYTQESVSPVAITDKLLPVDVVVLNDIQKYRGVSIVNVSVAPIQYNSHQEIVRAYKSITYRIKFTDGGNLRASADKNSRFSSPTLSFDDCFLENVTLNGCGSKQNRMTSSSQKIEEGYLILSVPKYLRAVEMFAEWKKKLGFIVHVGLNENWTSETVKSYIDSCYNKNPNLYYLLILGDHEDVPSNLSTLEKLNHVTDLFYACMDGPNDYTPDLYYGRLPVATSAKALSVVRKIIRNEQDPVRIANFYNQGVHCAYFQDSEPQDSYADRRFAQTSEQVRDYLITQGKSIRRIYTTEEDVIPLYWNNNRYSNGEDIPAELKKPAFKWNGNATDIKNAIDSGVFYVLHRDHGSFDGWGDPSFRIPDIQDLQNADKWPIVFSMNCQTGMFDGRTCFAEAFLQKYPGGCVAIFGATQNSYSGYNDVLTGGIFDAIWPTPGLRIVLPGQTSTAITPTPSYRLGQILNQGMSRMHEIYGGKNSACRYTQEIFHCFGDPSMFFPTSEPSSFTGIIRNREIDRINVTVPDGPARITFYDLVDGSVTCYFGTNAVYVTSHPQNVSICVSGHNKVPAQFSGVKPKFRYIQNETFSADSTSISATIVKVGTKVTDTKPFGPVNFESGTTSIIATEIEIDCDTNIESSATVTLQTVN